MHFLEKLRFLGNLENGENPTFEQTKSGFHS